MGTYNFYLVTEFNNWLGDIGKKKGQYDSYINTLDETGSLSTVSISIDQAKREVDKLLRVLENKIKSQKGKDKKTLQSKRSGLRSYRRFLSYNPTNHITYQYNGIRELAELIESSKYSLIEYMIRHSLFPSKQLVNTRAKEIANKISNNDKIPARFSTGEKYLDALGSIIKFSSRKQAVTQTRSYDYFYRDNDIKVEIDSNGNYTICDYLLKNSSINIISGNSNRNCYGYMISHIWGDAINPLFFSNFWNIVLIPQHVSFILDKGNEMASIKYAKDLYKAIAYVLYEMSINVINNALSNNGKQQLNIKPSDDILEDAKKIIQKKNLIKYIQ